MDSRGERKDNEASEDIRTRRKYAKQQKKLEKKSKREEEFLMNLRKPKSTKVLLADRIFLEKISNEKSQTSSGRSFELSISDFPELSSLKPSRKTKPMKPPIIKETTVSSNDTLPSTAEVKPPEKKKEIVPESVEPKEPIGAPPATAFEKTKKKNPMVVNLEDLVVSKPHKKMKHDIMPGMKVRRMLETHTICGNMLDSSNPKRFRGKHREIEKRTFTKLKLAIIRDRIFSLKARENKSRVVEMDPEKFKLELDLYLSDLMKKLKLAEAERIRKSIKTEEKTEIIPEIESSESTKKGKSRETTKYRKYCDNKYSEDLDKAVNTLIQRIVYLQDRAFVKNPVKAKAKPRHVVGLRGVKKYLMLHKLKMVIIAPDLEYQETVFKVIDELKSCSYSQNVPCVFALSRRQLGYSSKKHIPVSALGIINYDGLEDKFAVVKEKLKEAQDLLKASQFANESQSDVSNFPITEVVEQLPD